MTSIEVSPESFTRNLRNLEAMYRRLDANSLTGRNALAGERGRDAHYRNLRDAIAADARTDDAPLCAFLDANPRIAARWNRIERRAVGLAS